ncbi:uL15 family ribosomal protein [Candidatus Woesearchaeota archaeon]|nr:uL15 family ribosomal protein [Candidatus Woesearchaeota archaeon]
MTVNKRAKNSRHRGSKTHGWGDKKKHRGSGHRGGTGNAGSGKKADCKKPRFWKDPYYFGKFGFVRQNTITVRDVNLQTLETRAQFLLSNQRIEEKDGAYVADLSKLGYDKLLSKGLVTRKWHITARSASASAKKKVEEAGGSVTLA